MVVTVHDVSGNVHVEDLQTVRVTPVDNTLDTSPQHGSVRFASPTILRTTAVAC